MNEGTFSFWTNIFMGLFLITLCVLMVKECTRTSIAPAIDQQTLDKLQLYVSPKQDSTTVEAVFTDKTGKTVSISKTFKNASTSNSK